MKRIMLLVALGAMLATTAFAQAGLDSYIELLRSDLKTEKKAVIMQTVEFTEAEEEAFWPIYREYGLELDALGDRRLALIKDYAENFDTMSEEKAQELVKLAFGLDKDRIKVDEKYYKKFAKATSFITAARVMQIENQIRLLLRLQIAAEMPLVEKPMAE
jgi:hypothetical protein